MSLISGSSLVSLDGFCSVKEREKRPVVFVYYISAEYHL